VELGRRVAREQPQAIEQRGTLPTRTHAQEYGAGVRHDSLPTAHRPLLRGRQAG
jgi:hypothetical protein